jgi:two-component system phosphate regulon response regulator OmpR
MTDAVKRKILLIDDDSRLQAVLSEYLRDHQYTTESALTGTDGVGMIRDNPDIPFDLVVLDIMLPDLDGFETLRQIRTLSALPVIMLTARIDETDRIIGLEMGADDYMHKPFNPRELLARIKAVLRRGGSSSQSRNTANNDLLNLGPFVFNRARGKGFKDGKDLALSAVEWDILHELIQHPGRPFSRDHLLSTARGRDFDAFDRSIDVHISRIRKKIEDDPARPLYIKTVWGKGYAWSDDV